MGKFCVFEGVDGSGKTTLAKAVAERLALQYFVIFLEKYANPQLGELIQKELKKENVNIPYLALLFAADRAFYTKFIKEKVFVDDCIVIADRYFFSSIVYQGYLSKCFEESVSVTWVETINRHCIEPDKIIYAHAPLDVVCERINSRSSSWDIYENREKILLAQEAYDVLLKKHSNKVFSVDTTLPLEKNVDGVCSFITGF